MKTVLLTNPKHKDKVRQSMEIHEDFCAIGGTNHYYVNLWEYEKSLCPQVFGANSPNVIRLVGKGLLCNEAGIPLVFRNASEAWGYVTSNEASGFPERITKLPLFLIDKLNE
jgi:hypothetical protein